MSVDWFINIDTMLCKISSVMLQLCVADLGRNDCNCHGGFVSLSVFNFVVPKQQRHDHSKESRI